jgi:hypothetical protein
VSLSGSGRRTLIEHPTGGYAYIPSLAFASAGVVARPGAMITRAVFADPPPLEDAFALVKAHLAKVGRPVEAVCGFELRMPGSLPWPEFEAFNDGFVGRLADLGLLRDGAPTTTRTNIAPVARIGHDAMLAFSYTVPSEAAGARAFIVSGTPEMVLGGPYPDSILRPGETSDDALEEKTAAVIAAVHGTIATLGAKWDAAASVRLYARHPLTATASRLLAAAGIVPHDGIVWYEADPPVPDLELEIDVRRYATERVLTR